MYSVPFLLQFSLVKACPQASQVPEPSGRVWGSEALLIVEENTVRDHLNQFGYIQVHRTRWDSSKAAKGVGLCHCEVTIIFERSC